MPSRSDYERLLEAARKETGIEALVADESGLVTVQVDEKYIVNFQFVEATGKMLCFIEVAELPADAPAAVYRDLLAGGLFGRDTAGGYFALEPETGTVVYNYFFDLDEASKDVEEFVRTIEKILPLCDMWAERIRDSMSSGSDESGADYRRPPLFHINP